MTAPIIIDLNFQGRPNSIASFLIPNVKGHILIETGPYSTYKRLVSEVRDAGFSEKDIKYVLLTHIHLDHAGAAWAFAEIGADVYVHTLGYRHLQDPSRLMKSARMIYLDQMDSLWGEMKEIAPKRLHPVEDGNILDLGGIRAEAIYTPGHAKHHVVWKIDDMIFTGDVAGVRIHNGPVIPPCPPPDIDIELWNSSIDRLLTEKDVNTYYLTHFGKISGVGAHMKELKKCIQDYALFIHPYSTANSNTSEVVKDFQKFVVNKYEEAKMTKDEVEAYEAANPSDMSVAGLLRYWQKRNEN